MKRIAGKSNDAVHKINRLISKGEIIRGRCVECGKEKADAHHLDYDKPLEIIWLCRSHHMIWHSNNKPLNSDWGNYRTMLVREDIQALLAEETRKMSKGQKSTLSKTKLLEQILAERYDLKTLIEENEIPKK